MASTHEKADCVISVRENDFSYKYAKGVTGWTQHNEKNLLTRDVNSVKTWRGSIYQSVGLHVA
jgi:hypothetical protein